MTFILKKTGILKNQIDEFLDLISEGSLLFEKAINYYLVDDNEEFNKRLETVIRNEKEADDLRVSIEQNLYMKTLIPESRGDVLGLLENADNVIDKMKETLVHFSIENPVIDRGFNNLFNEIARSSRKAVEKMSAGIRAFFNDIHAVKDYIHKVNFFEREADDLAERLKREIFATDLELAHKIHIGYFVTSVERVSDFAKDVSDRLAIYTIKRQI